MDQADVPIRAPAPTDSVRCTWPLTVSQRGFLQAAEEEVERRARIIIEELAAQHGVASVNGCLVRNANQQVVCEAFISKAPEGSKSPIGES